MFSWISHAMLFSIELIFLFHRTSFHTLLASLIYDCAASLETKSAACSFHRLFKPISTTKITIYISKSIFSLTQNTLFSTFNPTPGLSIRVTLPSTICIPEYGSFEISKLPSRSAQSAFGAS